MNKVVLMGRLTRDPEVRYTQGENSTCIARYTLAVDRRFSRNNNNDGQTSDFIPCVAFGKTGEFYTNRDGVKVYTTEVIVEDQEFAESRNASQQGGGSSYSGGNSYGGGSSYGGGNNSYGGGQSGSAQSSGSIDGFMNIPDGIDEELPFT